MNREQALATLELLGYKHVGVGFVRFLDPNVCYVYASCESDTPHICYGHDDDWIPPSHVSTPDLETIIEKIQRWEKERS